MMMVLYTLHSSVQHYKCFSLFGGGEWLDWLLSVHLSPGRPTIGRYHHHITQRHTRPNKDGLLKTQSHNSDNNTIQNRETFSKCLGLGVCRTILTLDHV